MYGSTSVRCIWIVHALMPNRTYANGSPGVAPLITLRIVAVNPAAVVAATIILMQVGNFILLRSYSYTFFTR